MNAGEFLINYIEKGSSFKLKKSSEDEELLQLKRTIPYLLKDIH